MQNCEEINGWAVTFLILGVMVFVSAVVYLAIYLIYLMVLGHKAKKNKEQS